MKYLVSRILYNIRRNRRNAIHDRRYTIDGSRGFTLIEMVVVMGVIAVVSGVILVNNGRFGGQVLLQNLAYDIALSIRQAQVYGIAVQRFNNEYAAAYGMHFSISSPDIYLLFADVTTVNGVYDGTSERVQSSTITSNYGITALRINGCSGTVVSNLDILFKRPDPDAFISAPPLSGLQQSACITVSSPRGDTKNVIVEVNGQIAVQ